jgi:hypothetical protein
MPVHLDFAPSVPKIDCAITPIVLFRIDVLAFSGISEFPLMHSCSVDCTGVENLIVDRVVIIVSQSQKQTVPTDIVMIGLGSQILVVKVRSK